MLFGVYGESQSGFSVNPFLWTMHYELIGSMLVFTILLAYRYLVHPWLIVIGSAIVLSMIDGGYSNYACFLFGMWIAFARQSGFMQKVSEAKYSQLISAALIGFIAIFGGLKRLNGGFVWEHAVVFGVPFMVAIAVNKNATAFLSSKVSLFLGRISFPIFVLQFPVIVSITSWAIVYANADGVISLPDAGWIIFLSLASSVIASLLFSPVEDFTRRVGKWVAQNEMRLGSASSTPEQADKPLTLFRKVQIAMR